MNRPSPSVLLDKSNKYSVVNNRHYKRCQSIVANLITEAWTLIVKTEREYNFEIIYYYFDFPFADN